jgi:hypothetical protein
VVHAFDQQPAHHGVPLLADAPEPPPLAAGILVGIQPHLTRDLPAAMKTSYWTNRQHERERRDRPKKWSWLPHIVRRHTSLRGCHSNWRRSRSPGVGTQIRGNRFASGRSRLSAASRSSVFCMCTSLARIFAELPIAVRDRAPRADARTSESVRWLPSPRAPAPANSGRKCGLRSSRGPTVARAATLSWLPRPWQSADSVCENRNL